MKTLDTMIDTNKKDTLIIIDDCAAVESLNVQQSALAKVAFHGRHSRLKTWFITQKYNGMPKSFRDNCGLMLVTRCVNRKTFKALQDEWDLDDSVKDKLKTNPLLINCTTGDYSI